MIRPVTFTRHGRAFDQEMLSPTFDYGAARGPIPHPGNRPAIEGVRGTAAFYLVGAM
ncbi:protein of unknown function [Pseudomonas sp. JV551A1]|uniref:Uncharacterized protein n=1 Tax=Pseudomonas inefficax TaxID=2078786 RepID=A0AAQ1P8J9_9PSED|nr:protein of unknown function [Pseudomonas sp. JV551A1]SPO61840.1 protein of unknown function [Pseudomonas inefficax]